MKVSRGQRRRAQSLEAHPVSYWRARQKKDRLIIATSVVGCMLVAFLVMAFGTMSAITTMQGGGLIIGLVFTAIPAGIIGLYTGLIVALPALLLLRRRHLGWAFTIIFAPTAVATEWYMMSPTTLDGLVPLVPGWVLLVVIPAALTVVSHYALKPVPLAHDPYRCPECEYDLRGSRGAGCPECG